MLILNLSLVVSEKIIVPDDSLVLMAVNSALLNCSCSYSLMKEQYYKVLP